MMVMTIVATNMPPQPPTLNPRFQPEKSPEITAPDAKSPKREDAGVAPELAFFEIILAGDVIRNPAFMSRLSHFSNPLLSFRRS